MQSSGYSDLNQSENIVWTQLKKAFEREEGELFCRYPIYVSRGSRRYEIDFLVVHRKYGIWVIESKGCRAGDITSISAGDWHMQSGFYAEKLNPINQVRDHSFAVQNRVLNRDGFFRRHNLRIQEFIALPFISQADWDLLNKTEHSITDTIITKDTLYDHKALRTLFSETSDKNWMRLTDAEKDHCLTLLRGVVPLKSNYLDDFHKFVPTLEHLKFDVSRQLQVLDDKQNKIAWEIPPGPQRIRGLAGTGKTVILARRLALMHARYPDWKIAYTFYTKSLYQQVSSLFKEIFQELTGGLEPDYDHVHILHGWGSKDKTGFYSSLCEYWGKSFRNLNYAKENSGDNNNFGYVCRELLDSIDEESVPVYDAVIIDEAQDFPDDYFQLVYSSLNEHKRLYYAYDEAQSIGDLIIPSAERIFGRKNNGELVINLSGSYRGGIQRSHNLNCCYRTPQLLLTTAHALNMGLIRNKGVLQGVSRKEDWLSLGYDVIEGDFSDVSVKTKKAIKIQRQSNCSRHPVNHFLTDEPFDESQLVSIYSYSSENCIDKIVHDIEHDLENKLDPHDLLVIDLCPSRVHVKNIRDKIKTKGIRYQDSLPKDFQFIKENHVTLSAINSAKGNEAWKVYIIGTTDNTVFDLEDDELLYRNKVFTALTRSKLWCSLYLKESDPIMAEIKKIQSTYPVISFIAFNQNNLKRRYGEEV